ncbi:Small GTPase LIP1 [Sesamum angolense]|uniref:Small GTPase LIP1 n=1 Tax=Sesamum angolense TaxID=2727404 RepID=A0AAE1WIU0_9LAMI|nr:Small GTPase LIP1 [Sesamum angolense]
MFWRDRERENKEQNGGPPVGQIRVLVVGDSGVGKTSLVHLIMKGSSIARPPQTVGCTVSVKHTAYGNSGSSSSSMKGDAERDFFIELWDISGHERYKDCRSLFYSQINGVMFVHDLSQRRTKTSLQKWAAEIAATGTFSAPLGSGGPGGLPVPMLSLVTKQILLQKKALEGAVAAKEARYDKEAVMKFFRMLIRRRYFSDELPGAAPWSARVNRPLPQSGEIVSDDDQQYRNLSLSGDPYKYNILPPLPAQRNLTPPPTLYPQQPMSTPDNYNIPRFAYASSQEISTARSKRTDINV